MEILLQAETNDRDGKRFECLQLNANFRYKGSIEELNMGSKRGLDKATVGIFATGDYIPKGEAILVCDSTGTGKSFLVSALGHQACAQGYRIAYFKVQKLLLKNKDEPD